MPVGCVWAAGAACGLVEVLGKPGTHVCLPECQWCLCHCGACVTVMPVSLWCLCHCGACVTVASYPVCSPAVVGGRHAVGRCTCAHLHAGLASLATHIMQSVESVLRARTRAWLQVWRTDVKYSAGYQYASDWWVAHQESSAGTTWRPGGSRGGGTVYVIVVTD